MAQHMLRLYSTMVLTLVLVARMATGTWAQDTKTAHQSTPGKPSKNEKTSEQRLNVILRVRAYADRAAQFENLRERYLTVSELAGMLWDYDEGYSRQLLLKTYESLATAESDIAADRTIPPAESLSRKRELAVLRREVIARIARRDQPLAFRLASTLNDTEHPGGSGALQSRSHLSAAFSLVDDKPEEAVKFAEQSLNAGVSQTIVSFLQRLGSKDPNAARRFFARVLVALSAQPVVDGNDLLLIGAYVFGPSASDITGELNLANGVVWGLVDKLTVVILTNRQPAVPLDDIRAYLRTAVAIINRPVRTSREKQLYYVAGYQLLPYVRLYLPEQIRELELAMQALVPDLPTALSQPGAYANLKAVEVSKDVNETLRDLEKDPKAERREATKLGLVHSACLLGDFVRARAIVSTIRDLGLKNKVEALIVFSEGARLIQHGDLAAAQDRADRLQQGIERTTLLLGLGYKYAEKGERVRAVEVFSAALQFARKLEEPERSAIILAIAGGFSSFDLIMATESFREAVRYFNQIEARNQKPYTWTRAVRAGGIEVAFPLRVSGVDAGFATILKPLAETDLEGTAQTILTLKNERVLGQALTALTAALLKSG